MQKKNLTASNKPETCEEAVNYLMQKMSFTSRSQATKFYNTELLKCKNTK